MKTYTIKDMQFYTKLYANNYITNNMNFQHKTTLLKVNVLEQSIECNGNSL